MKISFILIFIVTTHIMATGYAQTVSLNLKVEKSSIRNVFKEIEKQSELSFFFSDDLSALNEEVSINVQHADVKHVLDLLFGNTSLGYQILNEKLIVIAPRSIIQQIGITGTVTDQSGDPMPGVNVVVKGTMTGVVTDAGGRFSISVPDNNSVLVFSFVGYTSQEKAVGESRVIDISLAEDNQEIEEIVVIGYGTQRKRDLTGSVASISGSRLKERSYSNVIQSLSGQLPGVQISQTQGAPGFAPSIKIRGTSTINAGSTPLYVIDGIPLEDNTPSSNSAINMSTYSNPLNVINPQDIESIEILKDASSAAIYGSRGANGVVLITTKQGKSGTSRVELNYEFGISQVARRYDMMNAPDFMQFNMDARNNSWVSRNPGVNKASDPNSVRPTAYQIPDEFTDPVWLERIGNGTDWQDVLFRTGLTHNIQASVSGGSEKTQFMVSASYLTTEGVVDQNDYDRITVRSNLRHQLSAHFNVGLNLSYSRINDSSIGTEGKSDAVSLAIQNDPIFPVYNENGNLGFRDPNSIWNTFEKYGYNLWHPYAVTREITRKRINDNIMGTAFIEWKIMDGLAFKTSLSANNNDSRYNDFRNEGQKWGWSVWQDAQGRMISATVFNWIFENTLSYHKEFGDHAVTGLLGATAQEQRVDDSSITSQTFPNDMVQTLNAGLPTAASTSASEWTLLSYLARATYSYRGKYLMSAAIRADGCSRFGDDNRWGYFPSASVAWRMSEESFMQDISWLNNLKWRLSYGVTGNNQISNYGAIGTLGSSSYVFSNVVYPGLYTNSFPDRSLKWEKTRQVNVGLDASFFKQRLSVVLDYYYSKTVDLLLDVPIPVLTGFTSSLTNIGQIRNLGLELGITSRNLTGEFTWTTDFNISGNRNKVLKLGANDSPLDIVDNVAILRTEIGQPIGNFYGYIFDGVFMNASELSNYPSPKGTETGDPKVRDVNDDKSITPDDRTILGNAQPDFIWGLTNTFTYKGFDFSFMLQGVHGAEIFNQQARFTKTFNGNRNLYQFVSNYWKSESDPGDGNIFKPRVDQNTLQAQSSSYWVEDGSFIRIRNIRLGYTLPQSFTRKFMVSSAKVYVNVENLHVFSDYPNFDPESSTFQTGPKVGLDYGTYPNPRIITVGINLGF